MICSWNSGSLTIDILSYNFLLLILGNLAKVEPELTNLISDFLYQLNYIKTKKTYKTSNIILSNISQTLHSLPKKTENKKSAKILKSLTQYTIWHNIKCSSRYEKSLFFNTWIHLKFLPLCIDRLATKAFNYGFVISGGLEF